MRPTKISPFSNSLQRKKQLARQKTIQAPRRDIHLIVHEIANQLTVINLSCFKLRGAVANFVSGSHLDELDKVERAVVEMTILIETLRPPDNDRPPEQTHAQTLPANVYNLFDSTHKR